jgi:hypothetical protein
MSYTSGSSAARPPSTTHSFRHATRYQALLSGSGLPTILAQSREPTPPPIVLVVRVHHWALVMRPFASSGIKFIPSFVYLKGRATVSQSE